MVASADGKFAYISNYGSLAITQHTLSVVDLSTNKALSPVDLGAIIAPHGLCLVDGRVYFTAEGSKLVGRYDPATARIDMLVGVGQDRTHMLIVDQDGRQDLHQQCYLQHHQRAAKDQQDRCQPMDGIDLCSTTGTSPAGARRRFQSARVPRASISAPDGKELWAANTHDGTVSIIDIATLKVSEVVDVHMKSANRLKFTPDGRQVLISDLGNGDLVVVDVASRQEMKRISLGHGAGGILMAPDGSRAYVAVSRDDYVAVLDLKTLTVTGRIATGQWPDGMSWAFRK